MDIGAPQPSFERFGRTLYLAYRIGSDSDHFAVLRFDDVDHMSFGDPNDERLETHPLYPIGLEPYRFYEVHGDATTTGLRRWIITFHDDTAEITAGEGCVLVRATAASSAAHAIAALLS